MKSTVVIPAQIRAGRAIVDWSQEQLADAAEVALTSVRDIESQKRAVETGTVTSLRRALENEGVVFIAGTTKEGPGVRLVGDRPNVIRRPTSMAKFDGLMFTVEWRGKSFIVVMSREAVEDLGRLKGNEPDSAFLAVFDKHRASILDAIKVAAADKDNFDQHDRLRLRGKDFAELV